MKCPFCNFLDSKVIDSRPTNENRSVRRRRECLNCKRRFTTYESVEEQTVVVIKKDNTREAFQRSKILNSLIKSSEKRPIPLEVLESAVDDIEREVNYLNQREITSAYIGDLVMEKLREIDKVAYIRFASVYREFKDVESFAEEIENLKE